VLIRRGVGLDEPLGDASGWVGGGSVAAGWAFWTAHAVNIRAVVAELAMATVAVRSNERTGVSRLFKLRKGPRPK
jgi:hypothetical protein